MKIILVLGCWGRERDGFILCPSVKNDILDLTINNEENLEIKDYLDSHFLLFDRPLYNNIHTALWNIQNNFGKVGKPIIPAIKFKYIEEFCINHAKCGLFLKLELRNE